MKINRGELLWSKSLKKTSLKDILNFIMKIEICGMLSASDESFLIVDNKRIIAASCNEKVGDDALVDLFESFKNEASFYSIEDTGSLKREHPEIFLKDPEKALTEYLKSNPELFKDLIERIEMRTKLSREEIMARYKIKEPSGEEVSRVLSPFELKKKKAKLRDFKEFVDAAYGRK